MPGRQAPTLSGVHIGAFLTQMQHMLLQACCAHASQIPPPLALVELDEEDEGPDVPTAVLLCDDDAPPCPLALPLAVALDVPPPPLADIALEDDLPLVPPAPPEERKVGSSPTPKICAQLAAKHAAAIAVDIARRRLTAPSRRACCSRTRGA